MEPAATRRPWLRMQNSLATRRANGESALYQQYGEQRFILFFSTGNRTFVLQSPAGPRGFPGPLIRRGAHHRLGGKRDLTKEAGPTCFPLIETAVGRPAARYDVSAILRSIHRAGQCAEAVYRRRRVPGRGKCRFARKNSSCVRVMV